MSVDGPRRASDEKTDRPQQRKLQLSRLCSRVKEEGQGKERDRSVSN